MASHALRSGSTSRSACLRAVAPPVQGTHGEPALFIVPASQTTTVCTLLMPKARTMFRYLFAAALALSTAHASASLYDNAGNVSIQMTGFSHGYAVANVNPDNFGNIGVGQLQGTLNGASFLTYCTDLSQSFKWNTTYQYTYAGTGQAHGLTVDQASLLGKLYTAAGDAIDKDQSVAFQLAVWELLYEPSPSNVATGTFNYTSPAQNGVSTAQRNLANDWLQEVMALGSAQFHAQRLYSGAAQDFLVFTAIPQPPKLITSVPEPAGYALVGLALAGLAASRLRRR